MDISIKRTSITVTRPSTSSGANAPEDAVASPTRVTYRRGDPEFDTFEHAYDNVRYQFTNEKGLPKNFLGPGSLGTSIPGFMFNQELDDMFEQYYRGQTDVSAVEKKMNDIVEDLKASYVEKGFNPDDFMPKLIEDVYNAARLGNVRGAGIGSWYDGREVLKQFMGPNEYTGYYVYYDAKYYYQSEDMKDTLQDIAWKLAEQHGVTELNLPTSYPDKDPRKGMYENYNAAINDRMRSEQHIGNFLTEDFVPPKDFHFFYRMYGGVGPKVPPLPAPVNEPEAEFDSLLYVWCDNWSFMGRVPVRMDPTRYPVSVNAYELIRRSVSNIPPDIAAVLKNMDFYAQNRGQEYERAHPRQYA